MPLYGPNFSEEPFRGGKNIVASEHLQFIEAGATLDGSAFSNGFNDVGKMVARNKNTGKFVDMSQVGIEEYENYDNFGILNVDFDNDGSDVIAGEIIVRGSVYEEKLPDAVPAEFKEANPMIRYVNHI